MKKTILITGLLLIFIVILSAFLIYTKTYSAVPRVYRVALIGDSMIDTMQTEFPYLREAIEQKYPGIEFELYNYGIGAENVEAGLARYDKSHEYKNRNYPPLSQLKPDVIIVGSWSYNPFFPHDPQVHKRLLTEVVVKAKRTGAEVMMLKEIAPVGPEFGRGVRGVNWEEQQSIEQAQKINDQLKNVEAIAKQQNVPVIDVYTLSKAPTAQFGQKLHVNESDGIHASPTGHRLTAQAIVDNLAVPTYSAFEVLTNENLKLSRTSKTTAPDMYEGVEVGGGKLTVNRSIFANIMHANNLTTASSMMRFTKLNEMLSGEGTYTVFIPNNRAMEKLPKDAIDTFFAPEREKESRDIFSYHIVPGKYTLADLQKGKKLKTLNGKTITVGKKYNDVVINDVGLIETADIKSKNGIIHIVDTAFLEDQPEAEQTASPSAMPEVSVSPEVTVTSEPEGEQSTQSATQLGGP